MSNSQALIKIKQSLTTELTSTVNEEEKTTPIRKLFANGRVIRYQELTLPDNLQFPESDDGFGYVAQTNCLSSFKHRVYYDYSKSLIESTEKRVNQQHQAIMDKVASGVKEMTTEINELEQELQRVNTDNSVKEKEISNLEQMMKQSEGKLLAYTQEFKQLQQATTNQSRQSQQELNSLGQAANLSQQDLILRLTLTESHIGDLATQILVLEKTNKHLEEISESQQKNIARLESKRQQDLANKNKQQQIVEQKLQRSLDKIGDLEQDKTQMFEEWEANNLRVQALEEEIQTVEAKGLISLQYQRRDYQAKIRSLEQCRKIMLLGNGVKWITYWCLSTKLHNNLSTAIDVGVSYCAYQKGASWSYELSWLGIGFFLAMLVRYFYLKLKKRFWWIKSFSVPRIN